MVCSRTLESAPHQVYQLAVISSCWAYSMAACTWSSTTSVGCTLYQLYPHPHNSTMMVNCIDSTSHSTEENSLCSQWTTLITVHHKVRLFYYKKIMTLFQIINTIHPMEHLVSVLIKGVFGMSSLQRYSF